MAFTTDIHTTKRHRFGTRRRDIAGNEYVYLKGVTGTVVGSWVLYDEVGVTALLDSDAAATSSGGGFVGVSMAILDAATKFGWYLIWGTGSAKAATVVDDAEVFAGTTGGTADDTGTGGMQVVGAKWRSADSGGLATVQVSYPLMGIDVA